MLVTNRLPNIMAPDNYNIFCDASIKTFPDGITVGCAGAIGMHQNKLNMWEYRIIPCTTNNNSEISAVFIALEMAKTASNFYKIINIFSDSKICVFGMRHWYEGWLKAADKNGVLYNSSGEPVANQEIFKDAMRFILDNNLKINIYHQNGHVYNSASSLKRAKEVFITSNKLDITDDQLKYISRGNDKVDSTTRSHLDFIKSSTGYSKPLIRPFRSIVTYDDVAKYRLLVGGGTI